MKMKKLFMLVVGMMIMATTLQAGENDKKSKNPSTSSSNAKRRQNGKSLLRAASSWIGSCQLQFTTN